LKILTISQFIPKPDRAAGDRRYFELLRILASNHQVHLFITQSGAFEVESCRYHESLKQVGVRVLPNNRLRWLMGVLERNRYDLALFEFWHPAEEYADLVTKMQPWICRLVDSVDLHFVREESANQIGLMDVTGINSRKSRELDTYRHASGVIVVSVNEKKRLQQESDFPPIYLIPIILQTRLKSLNACSNSILFIGGFSHPPNEHGITWFVEEIWSKIRESVNEVTLTIVGNAPPASIQAWDGTNGIRVTGYVPDTTPYLNEASISIAPLLYGGGMKGKVTEALSFGIPVVTTSIGAQGFGIESGKHAMIADEADQFADAVIELLQNRHKADLIGKQGQELVARICSPEVVEPLIESMIADQLTRRPRTTPPFTWYLKAFAHRCMATVHDFYVAFFKKRKL
jgi:O-antigen biosynthesis protein